MKPLKQIAKEVRAELKKTFPDCKFSVTTHYASMCQALNVALMAAPESPFARNVIVCGYDPWEPEEHPHDGGYAQLNHHHIKYDDFSEEWRSNGAVLTEKAAKMLLRVVEIANRDNWNRSDAQVDYFDVNYWFHLAIGRWNRPFEVKE